MAGEVLATDVVHLLTFESTECPHISVEYSWTQDDLYFSEDETDTFKLLINLDIVPGVHKIVETVCIPNTIQSNPQPCEEHIIEVEVLEFVDPSTLNTAPTFAYAPDAEYFAFCGESVRLPQTKDSEGDAVSLSLVDAPDFVQVDGS